MMNNLDFAHNFEKLAVQCTVLKCQKPGLIYVYVHDYFSSMLSFILINLDYILSCQPRVTVTSCFVYKVIRDL